MKFRSLKVIFILFLAACQFAGCASQNKGVNMNIEQNRSIKDIIKHVYTDEELEAILQFKGPLSELNSKYPVECLRETETMKYAIYCSNNDIVFVYFDLSGNQKGRSSRFSMQHYSDEFQNLQVGDTIDDVLKLDPDGSYLFLYTGVQLPHGSTHCTKDGYFVFIEYDEHNIITSIDIKLI